MNDPVYGNPDIRILEPFDPLPADMAMRKERERVARDLLQEGVVWSSRERHVFIICRRRVSCLIPP